MPPFLFKGNKDVLTLAVSDCSTHRPVPGRSRSEVCGNLETRADLGALPGLTTQIANDTNVLFRLAEPTQRRATHPTPQLRHSRASVSVSACGDHGRVSGLELPKPGDYTSTLGCRASAEPPPPSLLQTGNLI